MTSQPNVPVDANVNEEIEEVMTIEQELNGLTAAELKERIQRINQKFTLQQNDPGYLKVSGKKTDLVASVLEQEILNSVHDAPVAAAKGDVKQVKLSQIHTSPHNYRHGIDYEDAQLQHDIKVSGGLLKTPIVKVSGVNENGEEQYEILGGNRSTEQLRRTLIEKGEDLDSYMVHVVVRNYEGTEKQRRIQETLEMLSDNESALGMSPRDRLHAYRDLEKLGLDRKSIASKQGVSQAYVSQVMKLELIPDRIMDLVHFDYNKERIAQQGVEALKAHNVPFTLDDNDEITVTGISLSNANEMARLYPRRPAQALAEYESLFQQWNQDVMTIQDFLLKKENLEAAKTMNGPTFKNFIWKAAEEAKLVEAPKVEPKEKVEKTEPASTESKEKAEKPSTKETKEKDDDFSMTAHEAAEKLSKGDIDFAMDSGDAFADLLRMGDSKAFTAFKFLYSAGILQDV